MPHPPFIIPPSGNRFSLKLPISSPRVWRERQRKAEEQIDRSTTDETDQTGGEGFLLAVFCMLAISYVHYLVRLYHCGTRQLSVSLLLVRILTPKECKVTKLLNGGARIQIQVSLTPKSKLFPLCQQVWWQAWG